MKLSIKNEFSPNRMSDLEPGDIFNLPGGMVCVLMAPHSVITVVSYTTQINNYIYMGLGDKVLYATDDDLPIKFHGKMEFTDY